MVDAAVVPGAAELDVVVPAPPAVVVVVVSALLELHAAATSMTTAATIPILFIVPPGKQRWVEPYQQRKSRENRSDRSIACRTPAPNTAPVVCVFYFVCPLNGSRWKPTFPRGRYSPQP
ncbi:MAG: hypothetical protein DWP92_02305 [Armatimonadetes bacterium]|nr:MAG: hypothetical protein DWP92_02305 [Armatimonadota bacterium]